MCGFVEFTDMFMKSQKIEQSFKCAVYLKSIKAMNIFLNDVK